MIWECKIGDADPEVRLRMNGIDLPMRDAVAAAFLALTGKRPDFIFSGWGSQLTENERAVVENRLPNLSKTE
jgi:hypothetical protein